MTALSALVEDHERIANAVRRHQLGLMMRLRPSMAIVNGLNAMLVGFAYVGVAPWPYVVLWTGVAVAGSLIQAYLAWSGRAVVLRDRVSVRALNKAAVHTAILGAWWGASAFMLYPFGSIAHQLGLVVVAAGMTAGGASLCSPVPRVVTAYVLAVTLPYTLQLLLRGDQMHFALAVMSLVLIFALVSGSLRAFQGLREMVRSSVASQAAKRDLDDAIESTNDAFALFNRAGTLVAANSRYRAWFPGQTALAETAPHGEVREVEPGRWAIGARRPTPDGGWVSVHTDVTTLKKREEELIAAKQVAEDADQAKSQFLANMSHELRTPLNAIIGFSQLMRQEIHGPLGHPSYLEHLGDIHVSGQQLLGIINDILELARLEEGTTQLDEEECDLIEIIENAVIMSAGGRVKARRPVQITGLDEVMVRADRRSLAQVFLNLIKNAIKFTPADRSLGVRVERTAKGAVVATVWDEGCGIAEDKLSHVTRAFYQGEDVLRKRYEGAGLGLAIANGLMLLHGGKLEIRSVVEMGTEVDVVLPPSRILPPQEDEASKAGDAANRAA